MLRRICFLLAGLVCFLAPGVHARELTFGVLPFLSAVEMQQRFSPLLDYIQTRIGMPINLEISSSYAELLEKCVADEVDFAYMGSALYVQAKRRNQTLRLLGVIEGETPGLRGAVIVREDSPLRELPDLEGKRVAFTRPESTTGFQVPVYMFMQQGVCLEDLGAYTFVGNHQNVAYAVLAGRFDAGAVKDEVYDALQSQGLRILYRPPDVVEYPFVAAARLEERLVGKIKRVLQDMHNNEKGRKTLKALRPDAVRIAPVHDADFANMRMYTQHAHACLRNVCEM